MSEQILTEILKEVFDILAEKKRQFSVRYLSSENIMISQGKSRWCELTAFTYAGVNGVIIHAYNMGDNFERDVYSVEAFNKIIRQGNMHLF